MAGNTRMFPGLSIQDQMRKSWPWEHPDWAWYDDALPQPNMKIDPRMEAYGTAPLAILNGLMGDWSQMPVTDPTKPRPRFDPNDLFSAQ